METFNLSGFRTVAHNVKPSGSDKPELSLAPTANKFNLNAVAAELMGLFHGDTISLIENDSDELGAHYAVTKGFGADSAKLATAGERKDIAASLGFSWAGPWGNMLLGTPNGIPMNMEGLESQGVVIGRETVPSKGEPTGKIAFSATKKLTFTLELIGNVQMEGMTEAQDIYALTAPVYTDITPRNRKGEGSAAEVDETDFAEETNA